MYQLKILSCFMIVFTSMTTSLKIPQEDEKQYFPEGILRSFTEEWYSEFFTVAKEPSLYLASKNKDSEIYRFTLHRSFVRDRETIYRLEKNAGGYLLTYKKTGFHKNNFKDKYLLSSISFQLSNSDMNSFFKVMKKASFLNFSATDKVIGCDGSQWIFERAKNGAYSLKTYWSPSYDTEKRKLENVLLLGKEFGKLLKFAQNNKLSVSASAKLPKKEVNKD